MCRKHIEYVLYSRKRCIVTKRRCVSPASVTNRNLGLIKYGASFIIIGSQRQLWPTEFKKCVNYIFYTLRIYGLSLYLCYRLIMAYTYLITLRTRCLNYLFIKTFASDSLYNQKIMINIHNINIPIYLSTYKIVFKMTFANLFFTVSIIYTHNFMIIFYIFYSTIDTINTYKIIFKMLIKLLITVIINYNVIITRATYILALYAFFRLIYNYFYKLHLVEIHSIILHFLFGVIRFISFTSVSFSNVNKAVHYIGVLLLCIPCHINHA